MIELVNFTTDRLNQTVLSDITMFCRTAELDTSKPASVNMSTNDWEYKPQTLLYLLQKTDRFYDGNGMFSVLYDGDTSNIVACSGIYKSSFDRNVSIGGVRTWIHQDYRTKYLVAEYITPTHMDWCHEHKSKVFALTFNEYNKKLMLILNRSGDYIKQRRSHLFGIKRNLVYQNMRILDRMSFIMGVNQYVMYQELEPNYKVQWPAEMILLTQ